MGRHASVSSSGRDFRTLLHLPELIDGVYTFQNYILNRSSLEPRHRLLLVLRTAWLLNCEQIWCDNLRSAEQANISIEDRRRIAIGHEAPGWSSIEAALLQLADELFANTFVSATTWAELAQHYTIYNLLDAVMTVADMTSVGLLLNSLGVQPNPVRSERMPDELPYRVTVADREPALREPRIAPMSGQGLAITRTFAHYPALAEPRNAGSAFVIKHSKLSAWHREILILRTGWNTQSEYEWAQHVGTVGKARALGLDPIDIALGLDAASWNPVERALISLADELYSDSVVSDQTWMAVREHFDLPLTLSILATVANYRMVCMALNALGVQIDPTELERFPTDERLYSENQ